MTNAADDASAINPERLKELADLRTSIYDGLIPFTEELKAFDSPEEFIVKGKAACETAAEAITASLKRATYDMATDMKCALALDACRRLIKNYASANFDHLCSILGVEASISRYVEDRSLSRPRNFMMLAAPGSGKSHLVDCIAEKVGNSKVEVVPFNMATMESKRDLVSVLNECRNIIVKRKMPLVFLDEFDADKKNYGMLLPLLWDGKLDFENRPLMVGRSVFILAGSSKDIPEKLKEARKCLKPLEARTASSETKKSNSAGQSKRNAKQAEPDDDGKILDLFSRISGSIIEIPPYSMHEEIQPDKVVVAIALLRRRFKSCATVPVGLLKFVSCAAFRHSSRSIDTLINEIPAANNHAAEDLKEITIDHVKGVNLDNEPKLTDSPLAYHLQHDNGVPGVVKLWNDCLKAEHPQQIYSDFMKDYQPLPAGR